MMKNTMVVALFDCCREAVHDDETAPTKKVQLQQNSKGEITGEVFTQVKENANSDIELCTLTFGCKPNLGVQRDSCLGPYYIEHLIKFALKNEGNIVLPLALIDFIDQNKQAETTIKC